MSILSSTSTGIYQKELTEETIKLLGFNFSSNIGNKNDIYWARYFKSKNFGLCHCCNGNITWTVYEIVNQTMPRNIQIIKSFSEIYEYIKQHSNR